VSRVEAKRGLATSTASVGRNAAILAGATLFCRAGSFAVLPLILRAFSRQDYGTYSAAFAYAGLLGMLAYFGMNPIVIRDIARGERPKGWVVFHCTAVRMVLLGVAGLALAAVGFFRHFTAQMWVLAWLAYAVVGFDAISGAVKASMQAEERFGLMAVVEMVRKAGQWVLAIALIAAGAGITMLAAAAAAAAGGALAAAFLVGMSREDLADVSFAPGYAMRMLRLAAPMGVSAAFVLALENVDIWILDNIRGVDQVGVYAAAVAFKPDFLAQSVVWAILPLAFRLGKENREELAQAVKRTARYLLIGGAALAIVFFSGGDVLVPLLAGDKYMESIRVFRIMGLSLPFVFVSFLYLHALTAVDKQIVAAVIFAGGLAVNIAVDLALVGKMGATGAILGTLTTEILIAVAAFVSVRRLVGRHFDRQDVMTVTAVAASGAAAALARWAGIWDLGAIGLVVFAVMLVVLKAVGREDAAVLARAFSRKRDA